MGRKEGSAATMVKRLQLADPHDLFREAVKLALEAEPDLEVVSEARDGHEAVREARRVCPDVALVDAGLRNCSSTEAIRAIREAVPECRVLVVSDREDGSFLADAVEAGAAGYITKSSSLSDLVYAARAVGAGQTLIPAQMLGPLLERLVQGERRSRMVLLTRRERQVLDLLAEGADTGTIARSLVISPETARTHVQSILGKLGVHSRLEAAAFGRQRSVVPELQRSD